MIGALGWRGLEAGRADRAEMGMGGWEVSVLRRARYLKTK